MFSYPQTIGVICIRTGGAGHLMINSHTWMAMEEVMGLAWMAAVIIDSFKLEIKACSNSVSSTLKGSLIIFHIFSTALSAILANEAYQPGSLKTVVVSTDVTIFVSLKQGLHKILCLLQSFAKVFARTVELIAM
jgi:hypothetical protein